MNAIIIDYGVGNLSSVKAAIERCGQTAFISNNSKDLSRASHVILPGVGAFSVAMKLLSERGWVGALEREVIKYKIPLLGICLGMQLLSSSSTEGQESGTVKGLAFIPGKVEKLKPTKDLDKIPHVGWNEINKVTESKLLVDIKNQTDFYFVHSYHFKPELSKNIVATTNYSENFCSVVNSGNIYGVQFHPEKSSKSGLHLLENFLALD